MSGLIKIAGWGGAPRASVIFVHGLGGHARMENRAVLQENINVFE
jgi:hypothetical protein